MKIYKVGDVVWYAEIGMQEVQEICPICFRNKEVKLELGNGDIVIVPCNYCAHSYEPPTGYIKDYKFVSKPKSVIITGVTISTTGPNSETDSEIEYHYAGGYTVNHNENMLFDTREETAVRCEELAIQRQKEIESRADYIKEDKKKSFSWNAGYHLREAKKLRDKILYHKKMAVLCKNRVKEE